MSRRTYNALLDHTSDVGFRAWGLALSNNLQAFLLLQKLAEGTPINWSTATRPGINTDAGSELYKFNDSLAAAAPIYMQVFYGTSATANIPRLRVAFGTATSGTGNVAGITIPARQISVNNGVQPSTMTPFATYISVADGFFGVAFAASSFASGASCAAFTSIERSVDGNGNPTAVGAMFKFPFVNTTGLNGARPTMLNMCFQEPVPRLMPVSGVPTETCNGICAGQPFGGSMESTIVGGAIQQIYPHMMAVPQVLLCRNQGVYRKQEINDFTIFNANLVGQTAHAYLALGAQTGLGDAAVTTDRHHAMLWDGPDV